MMVKLRNSNSKQGLIPNCIKSFVTCIDERLFRRLSFRAADFHFCGRVFL
jgi:hypothetical protein